MIKVKFQNPSTLPTAIANFLDKSYAVRGTEWIPIPQGTKITDLNVKTEKKPKQEFKIEETTEKHKVKSSKGDKSYTVTVEKTNDRVTRVSCTCAGYGFRRRCKHSDKFKN